MIRPDRFDGSNVAIGNAPEEFDEEQRLLREIDFPPKKRRARPVFLRIVEELECVQGRAGAAAHDAHDDARIPRDEFLDAAGPSQGSLRNSGRPAEATPARVRTMWSFRKPGISR